MVPIATNHAANIVDRNFFPFLVANMLPSGNLLQDKQADFVAAIEEVSGLRVVGCADNIAMKVFAQNICIFALNARGHCLANKGKCLMPIEAAQLDNLPVQ